MKLATRFGEWIFSVPEGERSTADIILWWERRRLPDNLLVSAVGLCSLLLFYDCMAKTNTLKSGDAAVEPLALLAAAGIMNLCYTGGWIAEVSLSNPPSKGERAVGPKLVKGGLKLSLAAVALAAAYGGGIWRLHGIGLLK